MESTPKKVHTAGQPVELKRFRAQFVSELKKAGVKVETSLAAIQKTDYSCSRRTLFQNVAAIERGEEPFSAEKQSGRPPKLEEEKWEVVCGAILTTEGRVDLQWIVDFIMDNFGVEYTPSNVCMKLKDMSITLQLTSKRPMPKEMDRETYVRQYYEFVLGLTNTGFFKHDPKAIYCIDSTTNSRRLEREKSYNISGAKQKKMARSKPTYTDTYLAAVCMEDEDQYPALMFTHDPCFKEGGGRWEEVKKWCDEWDIDSTRIVYVESGKQYCAEASWQVAHFKSVYRRELANTRVLHDAGNSFKIDGEYILADGADRLEVFPSAPHGELSVLDNKLFAIAKIYWRAEREKFCGSDFSKQALYLLWCIDWLSKEQIKSCWVHNFLLDLPKLSLQVCDERLAQTNRLTFKNQTRQWDYMEAYANWLKEHGEEALGDEFQALDSGLDGAYWK